MLRDFSLRDFGASLNTVESYTNESSQGKIGLCETANKQKCTHLGIFLASEEIPMEMAELYSMKNTDRKFFTENWIEVDINVLRDLQMDRFYKNVMTVDEINNMFEMEADELINKVSNMTIALKNCVGIKASEMIADGRLTNIHTINALEKALNCELYER